MEIKVPQKKRLWSARLPVINTDATVHVRELTEPKQTRRSVDAEKYSLVSSKSPRKPHIAIQSSRHLLAASRSSSSSNSEFYLFIFTAPRLLQRFLLNLLPLPTNQRPLLSTAKQFGSLAWPLGGPISYTHTAQLRHAQYWCGGLGLCGEYELASAGQSSPPADKELTSHPNAPQLVSELINSTTTTWEGYREARRFCLLPWMGEVILNIPLCTRRQADCCWAWHFDKRGVFSVRSDVGGK
jgi:hypothetical protein